jgi:hypothetical protein
MMPVKVIDTQYTCNMTTLPRRLSTFQTVLTLSSSSQAPGTYMRADGLSTDFIEESCVS